MYGNNYITSEVNFEVVIICTTDYTMHKTKNGNEIEEAL